MTAAGVTGNGIGKFAGQQQESLEFERRAEVMGLDTAVARENAETHAAPGDGDIVQLNLCVPGRLVPGKCARHALPSNTGDGRRKGRVAARCTVCSKNDSGAGHPDIVEALTGFPYSNSGHSNLAVQAGRR